MSHLIDEFLNFFMYNIINHDVAQTCCSTCWLIIETILFLLVPEWEKVCICFINVYFFAPGFDFFTEKYTCIHVVIAEAKNFTVVDYFIAFFCEVFSIIDLLKEVSYWFGWIPTCSHAIKIGCEVRGSDVFVLSVYVIKKSKRITLTKLGDVTFESGRLFFWELVSDYDFTFLEFASRIGFDRKVSC